MAGPNHFDKILSGIIQGRLSTGLDELVRGYRLCSLSEGKSEKTVAIVECAVRYLKEFLKGRGLSCDVQAIGASELREFSLYLQRRPRFARHRFTPPQPQNLAGHTVNGYMRALQSFWAWLEREGFISENPFRVINVPKAPKKVIPSFSEEQIRQIFRQIDTGSPTGWRDYAIILTLLDTGLRSSELTALRRSDVDLDRRLLKVQGKGKKERLVPVGARVQKAIWKYLTKHRPEPAMPWYDHVFLTRNGYPLTKDRLEAIVEHYGRKAGIRGVRVSPHTFRHTMAIMFLRNGGDVFSLQHILGHSSLEVLRGYINLAQADISRVHARNSPADNLIAAAPRSGERKEKKP